jgi:hypothetical protein
MEKDLIQFPSELIQKELAKDPSKLFNPKNNIKEIPPKSKKIIEQKEKISDKNSMSNIMLNSKENINNCKNKELNSIEKNKNDININVNFFNIKDIETNINNVEYLNNINPNFFVNNSINKNSGIKMPEININEISNNKNMFNQVSNSDCNHYNKIYVNKNIFLNKEKMLEYFFHQNDNNFINGKKLELLNNINRILMNLKTYKGSIYIQELLQTINEKELNLLFHNLIPNISFIMCLDYGNYFFQKLVKKLNLAQRLSIYEIIEPNFIEIATNKSGTHSIQSLIECISTPIELIFLDKLLNKNRLILFLNENSYHIIMKIILEIDEDKRNNLNLFLVSNVEKIITNCNGAFCVNKFIHKNKNLQMRYLLVQNLENNIQNLIGNKHGCTILLLILEQFGTKCGLFIIKYIQNNLSLLSLNQITVVFIIKTLNYLYKYNNFELGILIWFVYKNDKLVNYLLSHENGIHLLKQMIGLSDEEQKKYIYFKLSKKEIKEE